MTEKIPKLREILENFGKFWNFDTNFWNCLREDILAELIVKMGEFVVRDLWLLRLLLRTGRDSKIKTRPGHLHLCLYSVLLGELHSVSDENSGPFPLADFLTS